MTSISRWGRVAWSCCQVHRINMEVLSECSREQLRREPEELDSGEGKILSSPADFLLPFLTWGHFSMTSADRIWAFVPAGATAGGQKNQRSLVAIWEASSTLSSKNTGWILGLCRTGSWKPNQKISEKHMELFGSFMRNRFRVWDLSWRRLENHTRISSQDREGSGTHQRSSQLQTSLIAAGSW